MSEISKYIIYTGIGCLAGISMGAIGIGAGLITMPLLIYSGLSIPESVAVIMVMQLLPQSAPGVYNYWNHILWKPTICVILGSIIGIWFGSYLHRPERKMRQNYLKNKIISHLSFAI